MASSVLEIFQALKEDLLALEWDDATKVFLEVSIVPAYSIEQPFDVLQQMPAALIIFGGQEAHGENESFSNTEVSVIVFSRHEGDLSGENALTATKQLLDMMKKTRQALAYSQSIGSPIYWASTSASRILTRANDPRAFAANELRFKVLHQEF